MPTVWIIIAVVVGIVATYAVSKYFLLPDNAESIEDFKISKDYLINKS